MSATSSKQPTMRRDLLRIIGVGLVCVGLSLLGWRGASLVSNFGQTNAGVETLIKNGTLWRTDVRTVRRVTKGKVITLPSGRKVVHVPTIIVHTRNKTIRVPAHNLPFHKVKHGGLAPAVVAEPIVPVTVTVYVPSDPVTVYVPTTITETLPASTETVTIPTTITLPFVPDPTTSDQGGPKYGPPTRP